jgi:hypothetical protein
VQKPQRAEHPQEAGALACERCEKGDDGDRVRPGGGLEKITQPLRLMKRRAAKSARMPSPNITSTASSRGVRSANDDATMNRMVAMSNIRRA